MKALIIKSLAALALVRCHDPGFELAGTAHHMLQPLLVLLQQALVLLLKPGEKLRIAEQPVFDDFGQSGTELALRQRMQGVHVADDTQRLMKRAYEILAAQMIDGSFATDRGIHLRQ